MKNNFLLPIAIFLIFIVGIFLRLNKLSIIPPHLSNDEISIAFDAYSIFKTGKDEYGFKYPISFKSQGTYKAPAYSYILSTFLNFFKNNEITAKLPSVIAGFLAIIFIGLLTYKLTKNKEISVISSLVLSITPWHIVTSRMVLEANIGLTFFLIGLFLFFLAIEKTKINTISFFGSIFFMAISVYSYHTHWIYTPLTLILLSIIYLRKHKKNALFFLLFFLLLISPIIKDSVDKIGTSARANSQVLWQEASVANNLLKQKNIFNKGSIITKVFISNYFSYTNPGYLFFYGLGILPKNNPLELGLFLWPMIIPFFIGIFHLKKFILRKNFIFFIVFTISTPIVVSLTHGGNILRNLISIIPYTIVISVGIYKIFALNKRYLYIFILISIISLWFFFAIYTYHYPVETASTYQGYKPIASFLKESNYKKAIIDYRFGPENMFIGVPHYYIGYFNKIDPYFFQNRKQEKDGTTFDKFTIKEINWNSIVVEKNNLYIVGRDNKPNEIVKDKLFFEKDFVDYSGLTSFEIWRGK